MVYFVSDLHLGASYIADHRAHEARVVRWLRSIAPQCRELYLLGDVLDYWYEYREVVPRGYVRFFGQLAEMADAGIKITWLKGNHDIWIFDYLPTELGIRVVDGMLETEIDGRHFLLEHGDGVGRKSTAFKMMRSIFRNPTAQWLFSGIHPRWTIPFAHRWSSSSRESGRRFSQADAERMAAPLLDFSRQYHREHPEIDYFIYGHLHVVVDREIDGPGSPRMLVLGDWISHDSYAVWDGKSLKMGFFKDETKV